MICKACVKEGKTSILYSTGGSKTLLGYYPHWDENGARHYHYPNYLTRSYQCSNGHSWVEKKLVPCQVEGCSYGK